MRIAISLAVLALAGCSGGDHKPVVFAPLEASKSRDGWASEIDAVRPGRQVARRVEAPALERRIREAAEASGARAIDVTILDFGVGELAPTVRLQADHIGSHLKDDLEGFRIASGIQGHWYLHVEIYDENGSRAWTTGSFGRPNEVGGGTMYVRPDLKACSPVGLGGIEAEPPPCPDD